MRGKLIAEWINNEGKEDMGKYGVERLIITKKTINLPHQEENFAKATIFCSAFLLLISLIGIAILYFVVNISNEAVIVWTLYYLCLLYVFLKKLMLGLKHRIVIGDPKYPHDFISYRIIMDSMKKGEIATYWKNLNNTARLLRIFFTEKYDYIIIPIKDRLESLMALLIFFFIWILILNNYYFLPEYDLKIFPDIPAEEYYEIDPEVLEIFSFAESLLFTEVLIIIFIISAIIFREIALNIIPYDPPTASTHRDHKELSGSHPYKIFRNISSAYETLQYDFPRRLEASQPIMTDIGIGESGTTTGTLLIESIPKVDDRFNFHYDKGMRFALLGYTIQGFFIIIFPIVFNFDLISLKFFIVFAWFVFPLMASYYAMGFALSRTYFWKSNLIITEFSGEYYRSNIGVGTSIYDSLKSERLSIISDVTIRCTGTSVLSQCIGLDSYRYLLSMNTTQDVINHVNKLKSQIEVEKQIVDVQSPNIDHQNVQKIAKINVALDQARRLSSGQFREEYFIENREAPKQLPQQGIQTKQQESNICPYCGKNNSNKAKFCSGCGKDLIISTMLEMGIDGTICPKCHTILEKNTVFCDFCGITIRQNLQLANNMDREEMRWICPECKQLNVGHEDDCEWCDKKRIY